jgi:hypothetical protein
VKIQKNMNPLYKGKLNLLADKKEFRKEYKRVLSCRKKNKPLQVVNAGAL